MLTILKVIVIIMMVKKLPNKELLVLQHLKSNDDRLIFEAVQISRWDS